MSGQRPPYWETPGGTRVHAGSTADDAGDFGIYRGQAITAEMLARFVAWRNEMDALVRLLDVSDDVARRLVFRAHGQDPDAD